MQEYKELLKEIPQVIFVMGIFSAYACAAYFSFDKEQRKLLKSGKKYLENLFDDKLDFS